jgi:hypothetical protein
MGTISLDDFIAGNPLFLGIQAFKWVSERSSGEGVPLLEQEGWLRD